jgi:large subunit ribosomal protein L18
MQKRLTGRPLRRMRARSKVAGTIERPRLSVFRSNKFIYSQIINDEKGITLAAAKGEDAVKVGEEIAKKAKTKKIVKVVFDKGGFAYHGKVKALAEAARAGGLEF